MVSMKCRYRTVIAKANPRHGQLPSLGNMTPPEIVWDCSLDAVCVCPRVLDQVVGDGELPVRPESISIKSVLVCLDCNFRSQ